MSSTLQSVAWKGYTYYEIKKGTGRFFRLTKADLPQELPSDEKRLRTSAYSSSRVSAFEGEFWR